jgi:hypothetical protein
MKLVATYTVKSVYGQPTAYPQNRQAKLLCDLAGTKTLTPHVKKYAEALGYEVIRVMDESADPFASDRETIAEMVSDPVAFVQKMFNEG